MVPMKLVDGCYQAVIPISANQRVIVIDEEEIGIRVISQERTDRGPDRPATWKRGEEECLIPRAAVPDLVDVLRRMVSCEGHGSA